MINNKCLCIGLISIIIIIFTCIVYKLYKNKLVVQENYQNAANHDHDESVLKQLKDAIDKHMQSHQKVHGPGMHGSKDDHTHDDLQGAPGPQGEPGKTGRPGRQGKTYTLTD